MGKFCSKRKRDTENQTVPSQPAQPIDPGLQRLRATLNQDLEKFLLNNILLSVQFFEHYEREMKTLRDSPVSEGDAERKKALAEHHRYCISPDRLDEVVRRRVLFRTAHGERSHSYEQLHSTRLMVAQDNVEVVQQLRDEVVYATVQGAPNYRFAMEPTTKKRSGYVKLRAEECMLPHKRRATYETINEDEGVYTGIPSDSPNGNDSARSINEEQVVESDNPETQDLTETESAVNGPPFHAVQSTDTDPTQTQGRNPTKRVFGPQHPNCDPNKAATFTPTERRLSGIMRRPGRHDTRTFQKHRGIQRVAQVTPNLAAIHSPKSSSSSGYRSGGGSLDDDANGSEYGYTTITEMTRPRPLQEHRLGHMPQNTSEIPEMCFHEIEVPLYDDEESGNTWHRKKLFETRYYLNSDLFMRSFADIFIDKIGATLGFTTALNSAMAQGTKILCNTNQINHDSKPIKIEHEIIPTIFSATWPEEALQRKPRKSGNVRGSAPGVQDGWPTQTMMNDLKNYGCHLLPVGYMPTRGRNEEQYLEWQLGFPEAERYLETRLTHAQVRCLLFSMALYKTFLEPLNTQMGLLPIHIRTVLFWQCERNYANWPEDRPGEILRKFLDKLYEAIKQKHLEDYFIERRNLFESTPQKHLLKVQEKLLRIRENPVMHVLLALRNLRYTDTAFYPVLDCKKLYDIIISHENARLQEPLNSTVTPKNEQSKQQSEEEEPDEDITDSNTDLWKDIIAKDKEKKWAHAVRKQIQFEKAAQKLKSPGTAPQTRQRKPSTDSIDIKLQQKKSVNKKKMADLLDFFIPHFIEIARKSNHFKATKQARFYQQHAERLQKLLRECAVQGHKEQYFSKEFDVLYEEMGKESITQLPTPTLLKRSVSRETPPKPGRRSVHFTKSTQSQGHILNNANPFRKKMNPQSPLPSTKTCDEQSQPNTTIVTRAQVYKPNTSRKTHTPPSKSTSPQSINDVTDNPHPSPALKLTDDITVESTDS